MNFGAPNWLWTLAILPLLVLLYAQAERRSAIKLREFVSPRLLPQLAGNVDRVRRAIRFAFVLLALALAIGALAKPRWGYTYEDVKRRGLDLLFAVDTSRSMLSNDVAPNRLERVKLAAQDLITDLQGDRVGLIAFAGRAFLQAPLTIDYDAAVESINDLDTKTIPEGGTNIGEAIALATRTFGKSAMGNRALIIFTDGEELSGDAVNEAKKAADAGVKIFTIGVGTAQGSLIPVEGKGEGGFVKDAKGQVVKSKLDENRLREIAQATGGMYLHLESGPQTMRQLYTEGLSKLKTAEIDARLSSRPIERYEWPVGGAIAVLIASLFLNDRKKARPQAMRRAPVKREALVTVAILLVAAAHAYAVSGIDLYNKGQYEDAYAQFQKDLQHNINPADMPKMQFDAGVAAYKLRNYDKALEAFSQSLVDRSPGLQEKSRYNLGRTLEDRADLRKTNEDALKDLENSAQHYEQALKLDPQDKAAAERLEIVRKKIERLKKHPEQPPPKPQKNQQNKKDQKKEEEQQQQQQEQQRQQQSQDEQQQNQDQQKQDQQQAKNNQGQRNQQNQEQNPENQKDQQNSEKRDKQQPQAQPSPSPSPGGEQKQPDQKKNEQRGAGESPTPTPDGSSNPSPSPGESGENPSPSPGDNSGKDENVSPGATPSASPTKPRSGEIKSASEPSDEQRKEQAAEAEAMERGEMSPKQAARLLQAMKDEEARVQLDERKPVHRVYNDW